MLLRNYRIEFMLEKFRFCQQMFFRTVMEKDGTLMNDPFYDNEYIHLEYLEQRIQGNVPEAPKTNEMKLPEKTSVVPVP